MSKEVDVKGKESSEEKKIEAFGADAYTESARAVREVGAKVILSIIAAILIWLFGEMIFLPISKSLTQIFLGYPVHSIISFIIVVVLAIIIFSIFIDIRRLTGAIAGVLAFEVGKVSGDADMEAFRNYRIALDGIIYVIIVALTYLLFADYMGQIHPGIPAIVLILIVIWSMFALWRSTRAIANILGRHTAKWAEELEKRARK